MIESFERIPEPSAELARRQDRVKRCFDIALAMISIAVLAPLILMVSALLLLAQGRPLFDSDRRIGRSGVPFGRLRFRTSDRRGVTALGHILLRTNIDEMPQLMNVLRGDMSFVGPPPMLAPVSAMTDQAAALVPIRPGLACPWGEDVEKAEIRRMDLIGAYIRTWSLRADIGVLIRAITLPDGRRATP